MFWFGSDVFILDVIVLCFFSSVVVYFEFVYGSEGVVYIVEGNVLFWIEERLLYVVLKFDFIVNYF